jgi:dTDP-4-amino-4,6-dideoxygalactose transaminase
MQAEYPLQSFGPQLRRLLLFALLKALARPALFGGFVAGCRLAGIDHDRLVSRLMRSSRRGSLIRRLRRRPGPALLRLLARRLRQDHARRLARRIERAQRVIAALPAGAVPGATAPVHSHWVLPLCCDDPEATVRRLWAAGVDASRTASSMALITAPERATPVAAALMATLLYLPQHPAFNAATLRRVEQAVGR